MPLTPVRDGIEAVPPATLVLTNSPRVADHPSLEKRAVQVLCTDPARQGASAGESSTTFSQRTDDSIEHVRVVLDTSTAREPGSQHPTTACTRLHELAFLAAQRYRERIRESGSYGVVALGAPASSPPTPETGLFTGLLKCLAWELGRELTFGVVTDQTDVERALEQLAEESTCSRRFPHALRRGGTRYEERLVPTVAEQSGDPIPSSPVVVASGGGRGLTSLILRSLATQRNLKVWLLGSPDLDSVSDEVFRMSEDEFAAWRPEFMRAIKRREPHAKPNELKRRFTELEHARETKHTIDRLRELLGRDRVRYIACDLRDPDGMGRAAQRILAEDPSVDFLIHGAVFSHPAALTAKTLEDFRKVRDVKVRGYCNLKEALGEHTRTWCNFGSVVGTLGLPGDVDYASANDYLAAAAQASNVVNGNDEYTLAWTWWRESGFGGRRLAGGHMARTGWLTGVTNDEGVQHFEEELQQPRRGRATIALLGEAEYRTYGREMPGLVVPGFAGEASLYLENRQETETATTWSRQLEPYLRDRHLWEHRVHGYPTMPGAEELEMMAEAARALFPGMRPVVFSDVRFLSFLRVYPHQPPPIYTITASVVDTNPDHPRITVEVSSRRYHVNGHQLGPRRHHASAHVELAEQPSPVDAEPLPSSRSGREITDPYYRARPLLELSGPYASTGPLRLNERGSSTWFRLRAVETSHTPVVLDGDGPGAPRTRLLPTLLIDATTRVPIRDSEAPERIGIGIPTGYDRLWLHTEHDDIEHHRSYDRAITIRHEHHSDVLRCRAVAPDRRTLLIIENPRFHELRGEEA
ncbi:SDR family oxidoreductase [Actinopolyspora erythraea]|nr:SDR family oxidoreductase [Actinopolyspora erythraea]